MFQNRVNGGSLTGPEKSVKFLDLCTKLMLQKSKSWWKQLELSENQKRPRTHT